MDTLPKPRRYSLVEHIISRTVAVLIVSAAVGPGMRDLRVRAFEKYAQLPHEELLLALEAGVGTSSVVPMIGETFLVGLGLLGLVEGIASLTRIWVIPRS